MTLLFTQLFTSLLLFFTTPSLQKDASSIIIKGDSSAHEWEMKATNYEMKVQWKEEKVSSLQLSFPVKYLNSGKEKMDENAQETLGADKYPTITFESSQLSYSASGKIEAKGQLTIAKVKREVRLIAQESKTANSIKIKGVHQINMTDHDVVPPSLMFGMMKVDPLVELHFDLVFKKTN